MTGAEQRQSRTLSMAENADLDTSVPAKLVVGSIADVRRRYGEDAAPDDSVEPTRDA